MAIKLVRRFRLEYGLLLLVAGAGLLLPSCDSDGNFTIAGYSTASNFDKRYKTIRVPIFQNVSFYRGIEFELTQKVVAEIEQRTHYKVVSGNADLELTGKITIFTKSVTLESPVNEVRSAITTMTCEVILKDLRTGLVISKPPRRPGANVPEIVPLLPDINAPPGVNLPITAVPALPGAALNQQATMTGPPGGPELDPRIPPDDPNQKPTGIFIRATSTFVPELGQSITTAEQRCVLNMSRDIVNMMEMGW